MMDIDISDVEQQIGEIKISVVGIGGGGSNTINHLSTHGVHKSIKLIALNTDAQHLKTIEAHNRIRLGEKTTRGLGAGMKPDIGRKSAEESYDAIKENLQGSDIVFIATGLGGGTGTGATPIVAKVAKELGALTIAVVTKPFKFEGDKRSKIAEVGLKELKDEVDSIIVIPNEKLLSTVGKNLGIKDSFKLVDNVLSQAVNGISSLILDDSNGGINADYADLTSIMEFKGLALIGVGDKDGDNAAIEAVQEALESPLLDNISIKGAKGAIAYFEVNGQHPLAMIHEANETISQQLDSEALFKFAVSEKDDIELGRVKVTLIVTGFEKEILNKDVTPESQSSPSVAIKQKVSNNIRLRKVSGGDLLPQHDSDEVDIPTYLRNQQD